MHKNIEILVSRAALHTEILALRQQVAVLKRNRPRPSLRQWQCPHEDGELWGFTDDDLSNFNMVAREQGELEDWLGRTHVDGHS